MSEQQVKIFTPPMVQNRLYEEFMRLRDLLDKIDLGFKLSGSEYLELTRLVIFFSDVLYNELSQDPKLKPAIDLLDLFRINKRAFEKSGYAAYLVVYQAKGSSLSKIFVMYESKEELEKDARRKAENDIVLSSVAIVPNSKLLLSLGRGIILKALDIGILGFRISRKPRFIRNRKRGEQNG